MARHAGYPSFVNGDQFVLPNPTVPNYVINSTLERVLYSHQAVRSRNTWVVRFPIPTAGVPSIYPPGGQPSKVGDYISSLARRYTN